MVGKREVNRFGDERIGRYLVNKFPTAFAKTLDPFVEDKAIECCGSRFLIGEDAITFRGGTTPLTTDRLVELSPLWAKGVVRELKKRGIELGGTIGVVTTLPIDAYRVARQREKRGDESYIKQMEKNLAKEGFYLKRVVPQGISALNFLVGEVSELGEGNLILIDGGFNTINVAFVKDLKVVEATTYYDKGVRSLVRSFGKLLKVDYPEIDTSLSFLNRVFLEGSYDIGRENVSVRDYKDRAVSLFIEELLAELTDEIKTMQFKFDFIVFIGGLTYYLTKEALEKSFRGKRVILPESGGEYLNLLGLIDEYEDGVVYFDMGFGHIKFGYKA